MIDSFKDSIRALMYYDPTPKRKFLDLEDTMPYSAEPSAKRAKLSAYMGEPTIIRSDKRFSTRQFFQSMRSWLFDKAPPTAAIQITRAKSPVCRRSPSPMQRFYEPPEGFNKENDLCSSCSTQDDEEIGYEQRVEPWHTRTPAIFKTKVGSVNKVSTPVMDTFRFQPSLTSTVDGDGSGHKPMKHSFIRYSQSENHLLARKQSKTDNLYKCIQRKKIQPRKTFSNSSSIQSCYRMDDKLKYKKLLQQYTTCDVMSPDKPCYKSPLMEAKKSGAIIQQLFDSLWTKEQSAELCRLKQNHEIYRKKHSSAVDVVDLAGESTAVGEPKGDDEDLIISKEIPACKGDRQNSLEKRLSQSLLYTGEYTKQRNERYEWRKQQQQRTAQTLLEQKRQLETIRKGNERSLEDKIARRIAALDITYPQKILDITEEKVTLPPLTPPMKATIARAINGPQNELLSEKFNIQIRRRDIQTLTGLHWLNDEVINFYMNMLVERAQEKSNGNIYAFNTFFYPKLIQMGYSTIRRWTRKIDIFKHDLLLVPVHLQMHWCLATIDFRDNKIRFYDSMHIDNNECLTALLAYLNSEHLDKKQADFDCTRWTVENVKTIPKQKNGSDCGMFLCKFSEYLSRDAKITFSQKHMPYFRMRMIYEIMSKQLL